MRIKNPGTGRIKQETVTVLILETIGWCGDAKCFAERENILSNVSPPTVDLVTKGLAVDLFTSISTNSLFFFLFIQQLSLGRL